MFGENKLEKGTYNSEGILTSKSIVIVDTAYYYKKLINLLRLILLQERKPKFKFSANSNKSQFSVSS